MFTAITGETSPQQACQEIKVCPSTTMDVAEKLGEGGYCKACEWAVKEATSLVPKNLTEAVLETDLDGVCDLINKTATKIECKAVVKVVAKQIWQVMTSPPPPPPNTHTHLAQHMC